MVTEILNAGYSCCTAEHEEEDMTGCNKWQHSRQSSADKLTDDATEHGHTVMSTGSTKTLPLSGNDQLTSTEPARITSCGN